MLNVMLYAYHKPSAVKALALAASFAVTSAATLPWPNHEATKFSEGANNATANRLLSSGVDPNFHIYPTFLEPNLDPNSLLMSAVQLMTREALEDITGDVQRIVWHSPDQRFSRVGIFVVPTPQTSTVNRRMMIWGLQESLQYMMNQNRFASVNFRMKMRGYDVGSIEYALLSQTPQIPSVLKHAPSHEHLVEPFHSVTASTPIMDLDTLTDHSGNISSLNGLGLQVYCRPYGYDLEPFDVFTPVVAMIGRMAEFPPWSQIGTRRTVFEPGQTAIKFIDQKRQRPPFFENEHLLKSSAVIPAFMLNKGRFSEVDVRVEVDGVLVAIAKLSIERNRPPHLSDNASKPSFE